MEPTNLPLVAHSPPDDSPDAWHGLDDHLNGVAALARRFAARFGATELADLIARFHDLGKATDAFQVYIRASWRARVAGETPPRPGSTPHAIHGAVLLWRWLSGGAGSSAAAPGFELAQAVLHHHGSLRNASDSRARLDDAVSDPEVTRQAAEAFGRLGLGAELFATPPPAFDADDPLERELLTRMLVSALVDADRLDTEAFGDAERAAARARPRPSIETLRDAVLADQDRLSRSATETRVNRVRRELYDAVMRRSAEAPGTFRLTIPTGGGKTRTALAFALDHAVRHGLERVVVAIPFTSIIEQTADVYRAILGSDAVVEHHSNVVDEGVDGDAEDRWAWRLPTENWDAPVIVTTTVQLFESLFSNRTSRLRKVHRLVRSVIVLDEAQALPSGVLAPVVNVLGTLTQPRFGSSVVLCTATQPALGVVESSDAFAGVRELAPDPVATFRSLARVAYHVQLDRPVGVLELAATLRAHEQVLCVVNTTQEARDLAEAVGQDCLHLSSRMCPAHRRATLGHVLKRLENGQDCRLVSTQLIEAGVDVDFPAVYRALAPLDAIAQAAGRCNREGRRASGTVTVLELDGSKPPQGYESGMREAAILLRTGADLHDPGTFQSYFETLYGRLTELDRFDVQAARRDRRFQQVNDAFRMIDDESETVVVPAYAPRKVAPILDRFRWEAASTSDIRSLQAYGVPVRRYRVAEYQGHGWMAPLTPEGRGPWIWHGHYDKRFGLEARASDASLVM